VSSSSAPADALIGEIATLRPPPGAPLFQRRAHRLASLAPGHSAGDYLAFLGEVCVLQAEIGESLRLSPKPDRPRGPRPLDIGAPPPEWGEALQRLLRGLEGRSMPPPAREAIRALAEASSAQQEQLAGRVLRGELSGADLAQAPFVGAALQVVYACATVPWHADLPRPEGAGCPVCGSPPVAGVVGEDRRRFLCCCLCGAEWHLTRLHCAVCRQQEHVGYVALVGSGSGSGSGGGGGGDGVAGSAKAETCEKCGVYTKLLYVEKAPRLEVGADDLATLILDELLAEEGFGRNGRNLLLPSAA
jgi:FdhE protein